MVIANVASGNDDADNDTAISRERTRHISKLLLLEKPQGDSECLTREFEMGFSCVMQRGVQRFSQSS